MGIIVKKKEGESSNSLIYRFVKKIRQSGVLKEAKKRRFTDRAQNKTKKRISAKYRARKKEEVESQKKLGSF